MHLRYNPKTSSASYPGYDANGLCTCPTPSDILTVRVGPTYLHHPQEKLPLLGVVHRGWLCA